MTILGIGIGIGYQRGGGFSPSALFAGGEQGAWYDPSDIASMSQDDAGATPVTADGQTVGRILDKSGRGNHATQATPGSRPTYRTSGGLHWLEFDGTDDFLVTGTITPGTDKTQFFAGVRRINTATGIIAELSADTFGNNGSAGIFANVGGANYEIQSRGTVYASRSETPAAPPTTNILAGTADISADAILLRLDGVSSAPVVGDQGTGNYLAHPLYIGRRGGTSLALNGNIYGIVVRFGANLSAGQISATEAFLASKSGVTL